jgi:signal transduction histidine kinase
MWYNPWHKEAILTSENVPTPDMRLIQCAIDSLVDGLALVDADARVVFCNSRALGLLQLGLSDVIGQPLATFMDRIAARASAPSSVRDQLQAGIKSSEGASVEFELRLETGKSDSGDPAKIVSIRCFPILAGVDRRIGTGILLRDITRERTADAMKSQLLSTVSHELRTPLASIKGFATTLLRQDVKWDNATQRDFLRIIEEESDRLTEIIDNLLDMSQIEAGALRIAKEPTQLRQLIREVVDEMRMRTEMHYFVMDLPAELPRVMADPRRIRQVLTNLIGNAIKYSKKGQIAVACEVGPAEVTVSVSDQGDGVQPDMLDKIFERFFQVDNTSTRRVGGSGLGLSISRGIIQAHDGKIWAESVAGQGSIFRFTLPLTETTMIG